MRSPSPTLAALALLATLCGATQDFRRRNPKILEIQTQTSTAEHAEMDDHLMVIIANTDGDICLIPRLDLVGRNDYERGALDVFTGSALKGCRNFELPGGRARHLVLQHFGEDGWIPSFVRIILDDHTHLLCRDGQLLDNEDYHMLECQT